MNRACYTTVQQCIVRGVPYYSLRPQGISSGFGIARGKGEQKHSSNDVDETHESSLKRTDCLYGIYVAFAWDTVCGTVTVTV